MINIRRAHSKDITLLLKWGKDMYLVEKEFMPLLKFSENEALNRYTAQINDPNFLFLIAELHEQPVGYLYAHLDRIEYLSTEQLQCEIEVIYLEKKARRLGLSEQLINAAIKWAQENGAFEMKAGIFAQNIASQNAFKKASFKLQHLTFTKEL